MTNIYFVNKLNDIYDKMDDLERKLRAIYRAKGSIVNDNVAIRIENEFKTLKSERNECIMQRAYYQMDVRRLEARNKALKEQNIDLDGRLKVLKQEFPHLQLEVGVE